MEGGAHATAMRLGNTFQDVAHGVLTPATPEMVTRADTPQSTAEDTPLDDMIQPIEPDATLAEIRLKSEVSPIKPRPTPIETTESSAEPVQAERVVADAPHEAAKPAESVYELSPQDPLRPTPEALTPSAVQSAAIERTRPGASLPAERPSASLRTPVPRHSAVDSPAPQAEAPSAETVPTVPSLPANSISPAPAVAAVSIAPVQPISTTLPEVQVLESQEVQHDLNSVAPPLDVPLQATEPSPTQPVRQTTAVPVEPERSALAARADDQVAAPLPSSRTQEHAEPTAIAVLPKVEDANTLLLTALPDLRPRSVEEEPDPEPSQPVRKQPSDPHEKAISVPSPNRSNQMHGSADGERTVTQTQTSNRQTRALQQAGNAAALNYPGLVMRKIASLRRPRVNRRGTATVAFNISANGGIASIRLAKSSGNAAFDQAALQLVKRAAPFPEPPVGARRSFSIGIEGN